jgi:hypothetical protein
MRLAARAFGMLLAAVIALAIFVPALSASGAQTI